MYWLKKTNMPETLTQSELEDLNNAGKGAVDTFDDVSLDDAGKGDTSRSLERVMPEAAQHPEHVGDAALAGFGIEKDFVQLDELLKDAAERGQAQAEELRPR